MLQIEYTKAFQRDIKRLKRRHADFSDLKEVIRLVAEDTDTAKETLRRRHRAHRLQGGDWDGVIECHVGNAGNWLPYGSKRTAPPGSCARERMPKFSVDDGIRVPAYQSNIKRQNDIGGASILTGVAGTWR